ncbi:hypothetical protein OAT67_08010 [Bacteriovoracaceae bacterium]|nr:hypothetical protein [Bacteriovoracaceae bacterium]
MDNKQLTATKKILKAIDENYVFFIMALAIVIMPIGSAIAILYYSNL